MWEKIIIIIGCSLISFSLSLNTWAVPQQIYTNQNYLEAIRTRDELNIQSIDDVFQFVFNQLPDEVTVYPTENYYYYSFYHNGIELSGNIRLDALDRDKGIVHFAINAQDAHDLLGYLG